MKNPTTNDGKVQGTDAIAAPKNFISYRVYVFVLHIDEDRKSTEILRKEVKFTGDRAIECRKAAFNYAFQCIQDASIEGKLCKEHIDTVYASQIKNRRNINALIVNITCWNENDNELLQISGSDFSRLPADAINGNIREYEWYTGYSYETEGRVINVLDEDWEKHPILDYRMNDALEVPNSWKKLDMAELAKTHTLFQSKDGLVHLLPSKYPLFATDESNVEVTEQVFPPIA